MGFVIGSAAGSQNDFNLTTVEQQVVVWWTGYDTPTASYAGTALTGIVSLTGCYVFGTLAYYTVSSGLVDITYTHGLYCSLPIKGLRSLTPYDAGVSVGPSDSDGRTIRVYGSPGGLVVAGCHLADNDDMTMTVNSVSVQDIEEATLGPDRCILGHYVLGPTETYADVVFDWAGTTQNRAGGVCLLPRGGGGGAMVIAKRWQGFLRDLRAGLVPPSELRRKYGQLVTI